MATKITLRKANALQKAIHDIMTAVEIHTTVSINEFQNLETTIQDASTKLLANDVRRSDLLMAYYTIRSLVGQANSASGIDTRLSHGAYIDKRIAQLNPLVQNSAVVGDVNVLAGKLDKIRSRPADARSSLYGHHDEVSTGVLSEDAVKSIRGVIAELKKQKQKLNDEVLELNIRTEIELTPDVQAVLEREGVI